MVNIAIQVYIPQLDNEFVDNIKITHNQLFVMPADVQISTGDLLSVIDYHRNKVRPKYERARNYYEGRHDIQNWPNKAKYKPDNRMIINFPKKVVTTYNGFFIGTPVKIDSPQDAIDETITQWQNLTNFKDVEAEVAKLSSIYGRAYFYVYQDEMGKPNVVQASPLNTFLIYDDTLAHNVKYGVVYDYDSQGQLQVTLIDSQFQRNLQMSASSANYLDEVSTYANIYPIVPIIEVRENDERMSMLDDIYTIFDALDKAMSEKANDVDYFADAYLKIINADLTEEARHEMRDNRVINAVGEDASSVDVDFLAKPDADATQEHLIDRLVDYIYQIADVTNMNDEAFAGNPTGVALKLKYQPMKDMATVKSAKFETALRDVFKCVFAVQEVNSDAWQDLTFKFRQSIPQNLLEESQAVANLFGKLPTKLIYSQLPFIDDPEQAYADFMEENNQGADTYQDFMNSMTDQQRSGLNGSGGANSGTDEDPKKNQPTPGAGRADG